MLEPTVADQVRTFIVENFFLGNQSCSLTDQDSFLENGVLDSTGVLQLITFLEETYDIKIADTELSPDNLDSVERVAGFIAQKRRPALEPAGERV